MQALPSAWNLGEIASVVTTVFEQRKGSVVRSSGPITHSTDGYRDYPTIFYFFASVSADSVVASRAYLSTARH
jgi:hypothetical protein